MPTFKEDLHLGHKVALVETDDIANGAITGEKIADKTIGGNNIADKAVKNNHLDDESVDTRVLADGAVTKEKVSDDFGETVVKAAMKPITDRLDAKDEDLQNQIDSLQIHGMAVSNVFGDDPHIGVSQKTLTLAVNDIWRKIEEMTGEAMHGISLIVSPKYFVGSEGCDCHIMASTENANGIFEHIAFFGNGELITETDNVDEFEYDFHIEDTTLVRCEAKILGITYVEQRTINHYPAAWLGAGTSYADVMNVANIISVENNMRGAYDIEAHNGDNIFVVLGDGLQNAFLRADINGMEIPMTASTVVIDDKSYTVYTSEDTYETGTYNIDING